MEVGGGGGKTATGGGAGEGERSRARVGADAKRASAANEPGTLATRGPNRCGTVACGRRIFFTVTTLGRLVRELRNGLKAENFRGRPKISGN